jgi:hypothetical protein
MHLQLEWTRRLPLRDGRKIGLLYAVDLEKVPNKPGVYIFGRTFGRSFEALYVGKARNLRRRVAGQLKNNVRLMMHMSNASIGKRIVLAGVFKPKPGQNKDRCLALIERAFIRYFLSETHDLVNVSGTRLRQHEIASRGRHPKKFFSRLIFLETK